MMMMIMITVMIVDDDDNYDYNDDDDDYGFPCFFLSWRLPEDNRRQQFQTGRHLGLCPPGVLLLLWSKVKKGNVQSNSNLVIFICMASYQFSRTIGQ